MKQSKIIQKFKDSPKDIKNSTREIIYNYLFKPQILPAIQKIPNIEFDVDLENLEEYEVGPFKIIIKRSMDFNEIFYDIESALKLKNYEEIFQRLVKFLKMTMNDEKYRDLATDPC